MLASQMQSGRNGQGRKLDEDGFAAGRRVRNEITLLPLIAGQMELSSGGAGARTRVPHVVIFMLVYLSRLLACLLMTIR